MSWYDQQIPKKCSTMEDSERTSISESSKMFQRDSKSKWVAVGLESNETCCDWITSCLFVRFCLGDSWKKNLRAIIFGFSEAISEFLCHSLQDSFVLFLFGFPDILIFFWLAYLHRLVGVSQIELDWLRIGCSSSSISLWLCWCWSSGWDYRTASMSLFIWV